MSVNELELNTKINGMIGREGLARIIELYWLEQKLAATNDPCPIGDGLLKHRNFGKTSQRLLEQRLQALGCPPLTESARVITEYDAFAIGQNPFLRPSAPKVEKPIPDSLSREIIDGMLRTLKMSVGDEALDQIMKVVSRS